MSLCLTLILSANTTTAFADEEYYTGDDAYNDYTYYGDDTYTDDSTDYYYSDDTYSDDYYSDDTYSEEYYSDDSTDYYSDDSTDYYSDDTTDYSDSTDSTDTTTTDSTDSTNSTDSTESSSSDDSSSSSSSTKKSSASTKSTPNPNISVPSPGDNFYILDQAGVISSTVAKSIESQGEELYKATGAQVVVVTIDSTGVSLKDYAYTLFNKWEIGGEDGYGVLVVLSIKEDVYYSMSGSGLMNSLDNTALSSLNTTYLEPYFAEQKYSEGIDAIYPQIVTKVKSYMERSGNAVAQTDSSSSSESSETSETSESSSSTQSSANTKSILGTVVRVIGIILIICAVLALAIIGVFAGRAAYLKNNKAKKSKNNPPRSSSRNTQRNPQRNSQRNSNPQRQSSSRNSSRSSRDYDRRDF